MPTRTSSRKKAPSKKARTTAKRTTGSKTATKTRSSRKGLKDPHGGLTNKGREYFKKKEGANLKPGVKGKADTPEKMRRKGSFLRRHYANLRGPLKDEKGEPTRLALQAHAWGEKVPKTVAEAKALATKGTKLLEKYQSSKASKGKRKSKTNTSSKRKAKTKTRSKTKVTSKAKSRTQAKAKKKSSTRARKSA